MTYQQQKERLAGLAPGRFVRQSRDQRNSHERPTTGPSSANRRRNAGISAEQPLQQNAAGQR